MVLLRAQSAAVPPSGVTSVAAGRARSGVAIRAGRIASAASRVAGRGSGDVVGGRVALKLDPTLLARLGSGRVAAYVCGTNGKTTTTRLLREALAVAGPVVSNESGSNMTAGLVTALFRRPVGRRGDGPAGTDPLVPAVLEVDELYLPSALTATGARTVVLLNLTRDQLDRTAEMQRIAARWRDVFAGLTSATTVVANCDDPRVTWAAAAAASVVWVAVGQPWTADNAVCPSCGDLLRLGVPGATGAEAGWACTACDLRRPVPDAELVGERLVQNGSELPVSLSLPGNANVRNAAMAAVAAGLLGVSAAVSLGAMAGVRQVEGRYGITDIDGVQSRLLLAKNPAGWAEMLTMVGGRPGPLVLAIESAVVDGRDTSWLYDVPFHRLDTRDVVVSGASGVDLALRLRYAGINATLEPDLSRAVAAAAALRERRGVWGEPVDVVGDYTSFQRFRRLARGGRRG